ncbi:MAG: AAA family ATPase, partial [Acetivibrio sp.]
GRKVSFKKTVIIMTSNAGAQKIIEPKNLGFASVQNDTADYKKMKDGVIEEVKRLFKPEFINRIDEIIVFHSLTKENIKVIVGIMLKEITKRCESQMNIKLKATSGVVDYIVSKGYDHKYGARPLRRSIQTNIEDKLAEAVLDGTIKNGDEVSAKMKGKEVTFSIK